MLDANDHAPLKDLPRPYRPTHEFNLNLRVLAETFPGTAADIERLISDDYLDSVKLGATTIVDAAAIGCAFMTASDQDATIYPLFEIDQN